MSAAPVESGRRTRGLWVRGALAVVLSVAANAALVVAASAAGIAPGFRALTLPPVVTLSAVGAVGAVLAYLVVRRVSDRPDRTFRLLAAAVLVLSFLPDVGLLVADEAATVPGVAVLMLMHVVVAGVCVALLTGVRR